jgi:hypothetical protein
MGEVLRPRLSRPSLALEQAVVGQGNEVLTSLNEQTAQLWRLHRRRQENNEKGLFPPRTKCALVREFVCFGVTRVLLKLGFQFALQRN